MDDAGTQLPSFDGQSGKVARRQLQPRQPVAAQSSGAIVTRMPSSALVKLIWHESRELALR